MHESNFVPICQNRNLLILLNILCSKNGQKTDDFLTVFEPQNCPNLKKPTKCCLGSENPSKMGNLENWPKLTLSSDSTRMLYRSSQTQLGVVLKSGHLILAIALKPFAGKGSRDLPATECDREMVKLDADWRLYRYGESLASRTMKLGSQILWPFSLLHRWCLVRSSHSCLCTRYRHWYLGIT